MNSIRDIINVSIAAILLAFIGISLARLTFFFLQSQHIL
jgi:hypothetical protein